MEVVKVRKVSLQIDKCIDEIVRDVGFDQYAGMKTPQNAEACSNSNAYHNSKKTDHKKSLSTVNNRKISIIHLR